MFSFTEKISTVDLSNSVINNCSKGQAKSPVLNCILNHSSGFPCIWHFCAPAHPMTEAYLCECYLLTDSLQLTMPHRFSVCLLFSLQSSSQYILKLAIGDVNIISSTRNLYKHSSLSSEVLPLPSPSLVSLLT
jgi:hypothetical protein